MVALGNQGNEEGMRHAGTSTGADALADLVGPDLGALKVGREEGAGEDVPVVPDMSPGGDLSRHCQSSMSGPWQDPDRHLQPEGF